MSAGSLPAPELSTAPGGWRLERRLAPIASPLSAALYLLGSLVIFGHGAVLHPARDYVGWNVGADAQSFIWAIGWWPHAILHGENPFVTHALDAPGGINLAWATAVPGIALVLSPVTLAFGPVVAYNVAALLAPALSAWTAFLLVRSLTRSWPAATLAGAFFGFSPYMAGQLAAGHLHLTSVYLVPLAALTVVRYLRAELTRRGFAIRLGLVLAGQILISTEIAFTLTLALLLALAAVAVFAPGSRGRVLAGLIPLACGYLLAGVLTSPLLAYAVSGYQSRVIEPPGHFPADLLNLVVPTHPTLASFGWTLTASNTFVSGEGESGAYLGVVALALFAAFLWAARRRPLGRVVALLGVVGVVSELGTRLNVHGHRSVTLPWELVTHLPGFRDVLPVRLSMFVALLVAIALGFFAARPGRHLLVRLALVALAVLLVLPSPHRDIWTTSPAEPVFFAAKLDARCLRPSESVLLVPVPVQSYGWLWQAKAGYDFRMIDGNIVQTPPEPALFVIDISGRVNAASGRDLLALARSRGAQAILATGHFAFWRRTLDRYVRPLAVGGVLLYRLEPGAPRCGS